MNYNDNVVKVMAFLKEKGVCKSSQKSHEECYEALGAFLLQKDQKYSESIREQWFSAVKETIPKQRYVIWVKYVFQLEEIAETGTISDRYLYLNRSDYEKLPDSWKKSLDVYLDAKKDTYTKRTLQLARIYCSAGLQLLSDQGISEIEDVSYDAVIQLMETKLYCTEETRSVILNNTARMFRFLGESGQCNVNIAALFHNQMYPHIGILSRFTKQNQDEIESIIREKPCQTPQMFHRTIEPFIKELESHGYVGTTLNLARHSLSAFYLFLEVNGLGFHTEIMWCWFREIRKRLGHSWLHWRRILMFYEEYSCSGTISPDGKYKYHPIRFEKLPGWCREAVSGLLTQKEREFKAKGTVKSYRCACTRFCDYLIRQGFNSFKDLSPTVIREYAAQDQHQTFNGRTTCFLMVRSFLQYLDESGYTDNHHLEGCLMPGSAPMEKIIDVLTEEQVRKIYAFRSVHKEAVELRDLAIVLLGVRMGFRASDVLALRLQDIDWKKRQISIMMQKTKQQVTLPMPTDVGNTIYSYLLYGRPKVKNDHLFVRSRAPYGKLTGKVCIKALYRILPERQKVKGGGFHVTRRTFATSLLKGHAGVDEVIDALGHRDQTSVMKYLLLDADRSRKCGLSMQETGISPKGGPA